MTSPEEEEEDEEEDQRLTDQEIERGLKIYNEEDPEQYRAVWAGKIKLEDILSKIFVDVKQTSEAIREEGRAKGLNKKQTDLLNADTALDQAKDKLLAMRAVYQIERNKKLAKLLPLTTTSEAEELLEEDEVLKEVKETIRQIKKTIKNLEEIRREIEEDY